MHYGNLWNDKSQKGGPLELTSSPAEDFHVYGFEKYPNRIDYFVDGYVYQSYTDSDIESKYSWPFEEVFHFIINLAVGGHWPQYPDDTTPFPSFLEVDYIRAYDISPVTVPRITGATMVRINHEAQVYCLTNVVSGSTITWSTPVGATGRPYQGQVPAGDDCIEVDFGTESGFVVATVESACGPEKYSVPVHVEHYYATEFSFVGPDGTLDQAQLVGTTGTYSVGQGAVQYTRELTELYDYFQYSTAAISNPSLYENGEKVFFLDVQRTTSAPCTRVIIQLEDSSLATPDNYPIGRKSRHVAYMEETDGYQRLQFAYYDSPDTSVTSVDRITVLIDSSVQRVDSYSIRNFDSAASGCTENCEPLPTNECRTRAKSEKGACDDGFNNDGLGYDGDGTVDCNDSDCWNDPVCSTTPPPPPPPTEICNDGIDNDGNGYIDCLDEACASWPSCGVFGQPACSAHPACASEGPGDCCPNPVQGFLDCCSVTTSSCAAHSQCVNTDGNPLAGNCCPTDDNVFLDCCDLSLCSANPGCSGLAGPECCPTADGVFLDCCDQKPDTCQLHPKCAERGLVGDCCNAPNGQFLDCCEPRECVAHPSCVNQNGDPLAGNCCPTTDNVFLDCCELDLQDFQGSSMSYMTVEQFIAQEPSSTSTSGATLFAQTVVLVGLLFILFAGL